MVKVNLSRLNGNHKAKTLNHQLHLSHILKLENRDVISRFHAYLYGHMFMVSRILSADFLKRIFLEQSKKKNGDVKFMFSWTVTSCF